jgi:regulator of sigma E protease
MGILVWLVIVNIAVFIHELAHYWAAKAQGVNVRAFSVGMGPILWRRSWRGTEWRISAFPIGGYVDIEGLAPTEVDAQGKPIPPTTGMARLGFWGKFAVLFAGPLSNIVLAIVIVAFALGGQGRGVVGDELQFAVVQPNSAAQSAGIRPGDAILEINGSSVFDTARARLESQPAASAAQDEEARRTQLLLEAGAVVRENLRTNGARTYTLQRDGQRLEVRFDWSPKTFGDQPRPLFGVSITPEVTYVPMTALEAVSESTTTLIGGIPATIQAIVGGIFNTFTLQRDPNLAGPVGAVDAAGQVAQQGIFQILFFAGIINLSLGIFNLLPIPGLDGGRILLNAIVALRRKPFAPGQEETINFAGFMFVILFIVLVTVQDFGRLAR